MLDRRNLVDKEFTAWVKVRIALELSKWLGSGLLIQKLSTNPNPKFNRNHPILTSRFPASATLFQRDFGRGYFEELS